MLKLFKRPTNTRKLFQRIDVSKVKSSTFFGHAYKITIPFKEGPLSKEEIKKHIKVTPQFCGDSLSITTADLASYLNNNTVIYHYEDKLGGVMVVGPKSKSLYIHGICVPKEFKGIGKKLMSIAKQIARDNECISIRLECYGEVHTFYEKQGYKIIEEKVLSNSNSNSNSNNEKTIKYVM
jgi:GNAT superfamily N-acetyltransferase